MFSLISTPIWSLCKAQHESERFVDIVENFAAHLPHQNLKWIVLVWNSKYSSGHNIIGRFSKDGRITPCVRSHDLWEVFISLYRQAKLIFHTTQRKTKRLREECTPLLSLQGRFPRILFSDSKYRPKKGKITQKNQCSREPNCALPACPHIFCDRSHRHNCRSSKRRCISLTQRQWVSPLT